MPDDVPLHPDERALYGACLRPPPGTVFDAAIGTSFSLEFQTALAIPVTLALFAGENRDELLASPLALLEGLERTADRLAIFCEAGRIQAQPQPQSRLCALLERMVVEVSAPNGGAFHPKIWVLRYRPVEHGDPTRLRLMILSRNLTRDRSWDLSLSLDGQVGRGRRAVNKPLLRLLEQLPDLSTSPLPDHVEPLVQDMMADVQRADWELPTPFEDLDFAVNGLGGKPWHPPACNDIAIISPFCDADTLTMLADLASRKTPRLVGRPEELIGISTDVLDRFADVLVMDELAENEDGEGDDHDSTTSPPLSGLHAKAYLQEIGWNTAITIASGNATRPSLLTGRNVEVFATLTGKRSKVGAIADILGPESLGRILRSFHAAEIEPTDDEQSAAEERIERARRDLAAARLTLVCEKVADGENDGRLWRLFLKAQAPMALDGVATATVWPITRGEAHASDVLAILRRDVAVEIGTMPLADVTRYIAFRLVDESGKAQALFTLGLAISGLPDERHAAILQSLIDSREAFLRYLRLLLADLSDPLSAQLAAREADVTGHWREAIGDEPILEDMVRALTHGRDRLRAVRRLMERLERTKTGEDTAIVPEDFAELWQTFQVVLDEQGWRDGK